MEGLLRLIRARRARSRDLRLSPRERRFTIRRVRACRGLLLLGPLAVAALAAACGSSPSSYSAFDAGPDVAAGDAKPSLDANGGDAPCLSCVETGPITWSDFPPQPIDDAPDAGAAAPPSSGQLFGPPSQGAQSGGPCLVEPEVGSLYPKNWLRPRFGWIAPGGENLFELRLHVANQTSDLVVYTAQTQRSEEHT